MAKRRGSQFARALTQTNLSDLGRYAGDFLYSIQKRSVLPRIAAEVGAAQSTIQAIAEAKAYDEIGRTEITAALNSMWSEQPKQNLEILASLYETHPWVNICSSWIAEALAGVPLRIHKAVGFEDGKEVLENADDTDVGRMFRWINPQQSPVEFNRDLALWLLLTGEAYIAHTAPGPGSPQGIPHELYVLFSPFVEKVVSPHFGVIGYNYNVSGESVFLDASEVTYFKTFSPAGRYRGQGVAAAGRTTIATDQQIRQFNSNVLNNGVHLSGVLETEEDMGKEEAGIVRDSFNTQYGGTKQGGRIAVLWGGLKFSPQTILQKDIMMTEQQQTARDEIIALYGLKPELLTEKFANKATAETVRRMAYEDTVLGRWGRLITSVWSSTGLVRYDPDLRAVYDTSEVPALQTSMKEKIDSGAIAISSGQWTINETREKIHSLPPIDGVEGDVVFVGGTPVANLLNPPAPAGGNPRQIEAPKGTELQKLLMASDAEFTVVDSKAQESEIVFARMRRTAENRLERGLRAVYREIGRKVRNAATRSTVNSEVLVDIEQIFFFDGRKSVVKTVGESIGMAIDDAVELEMANMAKVGVEGLFDVKPVRALAKLSNQVQRVSLSEAQSWSKLKDTIGEGLSLGESQAKINQRVGKFFDGKRNNAATIARTEITPAINGATMDVAIAAIDKGVDVVSVWVTTKTDRVRRTPRDSKNHLQAHGLTIIPGEEIFTVSGQKMEYPGDSWNGASADNTINCECGIRNEVRKLSESDERGNL